MLELTQGKLLARNTALNIIFQIIPLLLALLTIPVTIKGLGTDRFGMLGIAWMVMGYFSLFDLGLSRALIKFVGEKLALNQDKEIPEYFWTSLLIMTGLGLFAAILVVWGANSLALRVLKIPAALTGESIFAFIVMGCSIPVVITTVALWGVMEARQKFLQVNIIRTVNGILTMVIPIIALPFTTHIGYIILAMMAAKFVLWFVSFRVCLNIMPILKQVRITRQAVVPLLKLGGWMSVSNMISPVMVYFDRFLIGAILSVAAVAYYITPYEIVTKLLIIAVALNRVLFPAFSASHKLDMQRTMRMYNLGRKGLIVFLFPVVLLIVLFADFGLTLWVGKEFAEKSALVMQCLAIGVFFNAPAQVAVSILQGSGRADLTAKLHLVEVPLYFGLFWLLVHRYGINGAAFAWSIRIFFDMAMLFLFVFRVHQKVQSDHRVEWTMVLMTAGLFIALFLSGLLIKIIFLIPVLVVYLYWCWFKLLSDNERSTLMNHLPLR